MSKFCQNCGSEMEDQEVFCANCGTQNETEAPVAKSKKKLPLIIAGVVAIVLVVVLVLTFVLGGAQKAAAQKFINAYYKGRVASIKSLAPDKYWKYVDEKYDLDVDDVKDDWKKDWDKNLEDEVESEWFEDNYGKKGKITFAYQDKKEATNDEFKAVKERLNEKYEIKKDDIDALYIVDLTMTYKGDEDKDVETVEVYVVKIEGKWYPMLDGDFAVSMIVENSIDEDDYDDDYDYDDYDYDDYYDYDDEDVYIEYEDVYEYTEDYASDYYDYYY